MTLAHLHQPYDVHESLKSHMVVRCGNPPMEHAGAEKENKLVCAVTLSK
jgi:hypothetical protein